MIYDIEVASAELQCLHDQSKITIDYLVFCSTEQPFLKRLCLSQVSKEINKELVIETLKVNKDCYKNINLYKFDISMKLLYTEDGCVDIAPVTIVLKNCMIEYIEKNSFKHNNYIEHDGDKVTLSRLTLLIPRCADIEFKKLI